MIKPSYSYYKIIIDKLYKVLCLFEEGNEFIFTNINSLIFSLHGLGYVVDDNQRNSLLEIISKLESLLDESISAEYDHALIRREILNCINIVEKLIEKNGG